MKNLIFANYSYMFAKVLICLCLLLLGKKIRAVDQLNLAMLWDRADIARSKIFKEGIEWQVIKEIYFEVKL